MCTSQQELSLESFDNKTGSSAATETQEPPQKNKTRNEQTPCDGTSDPNVLVSLNSDKLDSKGPNIFEELDGKIADDMQIAQQSEEGYRKLAEKIVAIVDNYLKNRDDDKKPLREQFVPFFKKLLLWQYVFLIAFMGLNSLEFTCFDFFSFNISESLLRIYIVSVFVETLGAISVMLAFAFSTKEESTIVEVLTSVIEHYQKYKNKKPNKNNAQNENHGKK